MPCRSSFRLALVFLALSAPACTALLDSRLEVHDDAGHGEDGALRDGASADAHTDRDGGGVPPVVWTQVSAGTYHTCGLRSDGTLWCWGEHEHGRLGLGYVDDDGHAVESAPALVVASENAGVDHWTDWVEVTAGRDHTCGRRQDGSLWCWGLNESGQLGNGGEAVSTHRPVQVRADEEADGDPYWTDWREVTAGRFHTCGRRQDDRAWCWGDRQGGKLGDNYDGSSDGSPIRDTPTRVWTDGGNPFGWQDWTHLSTNATETCGGRSDGTLWCWPAWNVGDEAGGSPVPKQVPRAEEEEGTSAWTWLEVTTGGSSVTCGRRLGGTAWCWGSRVEGRLGDGYDGDGEEERLRTTPTQVLATGEPPGGEAWEDWRQLSAMAGPSWGHVCGVRDNGSLWCWGSGAFGEMGNALTRNANVTPQQVLQADASPDGDAWYDWTAVDAGGNHMCGIREDGSLWCWGNGQWGQRGDGDTATLRRSTPAQVMDPPPLP